MIETKEPINRKSLFASILALVIGIVFLLNGSDIVFSLIGYIIAGILILTGFTKLIIDSVFRKKENRRPNSFVSGIFFIFLGLVIAMFPTFIPVTISIVIGVLVLITGINKLILGIAVRRIDGKGSKLFILISLFMIILGVVILTQRFFNLLGAFMILYSISEIVGYVYYNSQSTDYSEVLNKTISKEVKEKEAKEAIIEEE